MKKKNKNTTGGHLPKCWQESDKAGGVQEVKKEWKFTLDPWYELPDIHSFVGSTFIINRIEMTRIDNEYFRYDIFIAPLPEHHPLASVYKSIFDITGCSKRRRKPSAKPKKAKKSK